MIGTIKLTRFLSAPDEEPVVPQHNWPLVIHATSTGNMPEEVFVFQKTGSVYDPWQHAQFSCVASAHDVFELGVTPTSKTDEEYQQPFYRSSVLRLYLRFPAEVEEIWEKIKEDVTVLIKNLEAENKMKAVDVTEISVTDDDITDTTTETETLTESSAQVLLSLDYRPAGTAEVDADNNQTISSPDATLTGWLPISEAPSDMEIPSGAKFFYNTDEDASVLQELPFLEPGSMHLFYFNGIKFTHGHTYTINKDGIFWQSYEPVDSEESVLFQDAGVLLEENQLGNAPWPLDYVDRQNPGSTTPEYELLLFRE